MHDVVPKEFANYENEIMASKRESEQFTNSCEGQPKRYTTAYIHML